MTGLTDESESGGESGYESDEGTMYSPEKVLGTGEYARARLFKSISDKDVSVLNPVAIPGNFQEAQIKRRFFQTIYPDQRTHFFTLNNGDYRLILPFIKGIPYEQLQLDAPELQKKVFYSATQALNDCHHKKMIVLDLKEDNIYYDASTNKSHLIDGGISAPLGSSIEASIFQVPDLSTLEEYKKEYRQFPPESWSIEPHSVSANPQMDVYSLGIMMNDLIKNPIPEIKEQINNCMAEDPKQRPTIAELLIFLESIESASDATDLSFSNISKFSI